MAVDVVRELMLDQQSVDRSPQIVTAERLDRIRAYLSCFYLASGAKVWRKGFPIRYSTWMETCCETLERDSTLEQDHLLAWLAR